jgi:hypothetical protein
MDGCPGRGRKLAPRGADSGAMRRAAALLALACAVAAPSAARGDAYLPPPGRIFTGVAGGADLGGYQRAARRSPAVVQSFLTWGGGIDWALARAGQARPMVHISTGMVGHERITPRGIARGDGDRWLLELGRRLAEDGRPAYVRLMAEMNGNWNPYCAFSATGRSRGPDHATASFRRAWQRTYLVLHGGPTAGVNARLRALGLPPVRGAGEELAAPRVAFLWVPQSAGNPDTAANGPAAYWPGGAYVDWVGTDFYSRFPNFAGLERLYRDYPGKPFVLGEWALWGRDDPGFVTRLFAWTRAHPRVRMLVYNQGERTDGPFRLWRYPHSARVLRGLLAKRRFAA